ncbi:Dbl homology domain-containing protein, partial [Blastocladiella britannica]
MHGQPLQQGGEEGGLDGSSSKALASAAAGADATADTADLAVTRELTTRDKVLIELLQTERKYVADLERLLGYMTHLSNNNIVSIGVISALFSNLKALVDFQRGFLIGLETVLRSTATGDERVGSLFIQLEPMFSSLYCIFCANFKQASETAMDQVAQLQAASTVMEPTHELPSFLIKPIQRICRYPLLLKELVKRTPDTEFPAATVDDLVAGLESIKRAVDAVNEARRMHENQLVKDDLARRVQDWKGYDIQSFGMLLLHDRFMMLIQDYQRDLVIFLFEKIIVCCKE